MRKLMGDIDRLLRGGFTRSEDLAAGRIRVPVQTLIVMGTVLGMLYGAFMGLYGATRPAHATLQHVFANVVKVPLLFLLTLAVAFPSLYVFSALADSRLRLGETLRLLLAAIVVNMALLASFGPVTGFFTLSTDSYSFMVVLNVVFFGVAGFAGLGFLRKALNAVFALPPRSKSDPEPEPEVEPEPDHPEPGPLEKAGIVVAERQPLRPLTRRSELAQVANPLRIFTIWTVIYAVVGAQMGWILRPFIGAPNLEFTLFRKREGSFFEGLFTALGNLFG